MLDVAISLAQKNIVLLATKTNFNKGLRLSHAL
jgi:hypothetical protein